MKVRLSQVVIKKGEQKESKKPFYYVEVMEPQRKYINADSAKIGAILSDMAENAVPADIELDLVGKGLVAKDGFIL